MRGRSLKIQEYRIKSEGERGEVVRGEAADKGWHRGCRWEVYDEGLSEGRDKGRQSRGRPVQGTHDQFRCAVPL